MAFELSGLKKKSNLKTSLYVTALSAMLLTFNHAKKQKAFRTGSFLGLSTRLFVTEYASTMRQVYEYAANTSTYNGPHMKLYKKCI